MSVSLILTSLGFSQEKNPTFASHVIFELWELEGVHFVKMIYNGEELDLHRYCFGASSSATKTCPYSAFKAKIYQTSYSNMRAICRGEEEFT